MTKKFNLLLPIAGYAQRFIDEGINIPKPLITVHDKHMIDWALASINTSLCNLIFAVRLEHIYNFSIDKILKDKFGEDIKIVPIDKMTEGAVSTCLLAKQYINNDLPLIIYTPDVCFNDKFDPLSIPTNLDGFILTFKANSPAHSYIKTCPNNYIIETAEKRVISDNAAVGVYYFKSGKIFIEYANKLIKKNIRVNNEFYICPIYNIMAKDNLKIQHSLVKKMHVLGTPKDMDFFIKNVIPQFGIKPIALCCDHSGYLLKEDCKKIFKKEHINYIDFGSYGEQPCDYSDYVIQSANAIKKGYCDHGIGFCKTGQGINMCANRFQYIRAALVFDDYTAEYAIKHNCANFFSVPSKYVDPKILQIIIKILSCTTFDGGRHMTRLIKGSLA